MFSIKRLILAVGATFTLAGGFANASGPVHRWSFDESAGSVAVDSAYGPDTAGTLGPGAIRIPGTVGSGAVRFQAYDLNGYVEMPASVAALGTGDFTISFWMQKSPSSRFGEMVGNRGGQSSAGNFFDFRGSDSGVSFEVSENGDGRGYIPVVTSFAVADGAWHKVTGVRSGPSASLYVDGVLAAIGIAADGITANLVAGAPFTVGVNDVERSFRDLNCGCAFDDVRIYDRALDAFEIAPIASQFTQLQAALDAMGIQHGVAHALAVKIEHAQELYAAGDDFGATSDLGAFVQQVAAQSGKKLTGDQAEQLGRMAEILIDGLAMGD